ncbi:MAG: glycoside hydrolase family 2 protein, partial [Caldilineaceae bacterium]
RRLRSHPSLALWCGNNENQWLHERAFWQEEDPIAPGALYYDHVLPEAVATWDGKTPYWPSSPYGGNDYNSELDGDSHNWNAWHGNFPRHFGEEPKVDHSPAGVSYRRYGEDMTRFCSEFGMHAAPVAETLRRNIPEDQLYHHSPSMDHHNKDNPKNKGDSLMQSVTGLPETLDEYIDFSMVAQAEGLKYGIEHYRRRKPHCSGTLFWQLNDCWPVLSWSVIDYYGFGKAGYYYARRVYEPVLASFQELEDGALALWVTNDTLEAVADTLVLRLVTFEGAVLYREEITVSIPANSSIEVWRGRLEAGNDRFVAVRGGHIHPNRHFFAEIKDLALGLVKIAAAVHQDDVHTLAVSLRTDAFAYFVHLSTGYETTEYEDNFFDLEPGVERVVVVRDAARELAPQALAVSAYVGQEWEIQRR